ncbi:N-acetyltransferase [Sphingomonas fennica]|uniref:N-acetyltransferase n=1 Tax=Edaphosphingomonas fennica TaxID=114404 RepID=A0A2T4HLL9_9SPHN|nr:N-acetyltransferase [Sphingomonas fennica]
MPVPGIVISPVAGAADRRAFVDLPWKLYATDPHWVPPLKDEVHGLINPKKNPWFGHAEAAFLLARRNGRVVGRISAQIDRLVLEMPAIQGGGPGVGHWGMFEAEDAEAAAALIAAAEDWLRAKGMTRAMGPFSLSIWDEPGLLVEGHDHSPTVMMGHHLPAYQAWIEAAGYAGARDLATYELDISREFPPLVQRIVASGERNARINIRKVDKSRFDEEAALLLGILNDAWSDNWGFVPLTDAEIAYAGKKLKPIVFEDLIRVAEVEGEPVAFMMTLPDLNELTRDLDGRLLPFGWAKLLWRLRRPQVRTMRVPLMGVVKRLQATRLASQLAFMMIEYIRRDAVAHYGATRGEIGWILEDNQGMKSIAETIESRVNKIYRIYEKAL